MSDLGYSKYGWLPASLDEFDIEIEDIKDTIPKAIVEHEIPFNDGSILRDMGTRARRIRFKVFYYGDRYNEHFDFVEYIKATRRTHELRHPVYGLVKGQIGNIDILADAQPQKAEIDLEFIEDRSSELNAHPFGDVKSALESKLVTAQQELAASTNGALSTALGSDAKTVLGVTGIGLLDTLTAKMGWLSPSAQNVIGHIDDACAYLQGVGSVVDIPASSAYSILSFTDNASGHIVNTFTATCYRIAEQFASIKDSPRQFILSLADAYSDVEKALSDTVFPLCTLWRSASASVLASEAAARYDEDDIRQSSARQLESVPAFDVLGRYTPREQLAVMNSHDLDITLYQVRKAMQSAIVGDRTNATLQSMAVELQDHIDQIKLERERIETITISSSMPLHLVCLKRGLSAGYARRIMQLNPGIVNPSYIIGDIDVYVA